MPWGLEVTERTHSTESRGLSTTPVQRSYDGRFGRLFQRLAEEPAHDLENPAHMDELRRIAAAMHESSGDGADNPVIPAGYVYLGQFIDHDLTFDPISSVARRNDPEGLINFRTPRFDLDCLYGSGPADEPFMYDHPIEEEAPHGGGFFLLEDRGGPDLPRNAQGRALIGDPRNDENGIVSQLHVAMLSFHNRRLNDLEAEGVSLLTRFDEAQRSVRWHYQWVVVHDFLRRTIGEELLQRLLVTTPEPDGRLRESARLTHYRHKVNPYIPLEFSGAAYRFGHSQVRDSYSINRRFDLPLFDPAASRIDGDFRGFQPLRSGWHASWPFFFEIDEEGPQSSRSIDTGLAASLSHLQGNLGEDFDLPLLNLKKGAILGLPSGEAVADELELTPLAADEVAPATPGNTPLWFYILRESQLVTNGEHLGPVGGRIVGETLLGLLRADPQSYLQRQPTWVPTLPTRSGDPRGFDMVDLLAYAVPEQAVRF